MTDRTPSWWVGAGFFGLLGFAAAIPHPLPTAAAQFIKEVDSSGRVTYSQDPDYDYTRDEPDPENRRINDEQLRKLREFVEYRQSLPAPPARNPQMTKRTGPAVCKRRLSLLKAKSHGCN